MFAAITSTCPLEVQTPTSMSSSDEEGRENDPEGSKRNSLIVGNDWARSVEESLMS